MRLRPLAVTSLLSAVVAAVSCAAGSSNPSQTGTTASGGASTSSSGSTSSGASGSSSTSSSSSGQGGTGTGGGGTGGADAGQDAADAGPTVCVIAPGFGIDPGTTARLLAPLSAETVDNALPMLTWKLPTGADGGRVELCTMRTCSTIAQTFDVTGMSGTPPSTLATGLWYWRVHAKTGTTVDPNPSATWELFVPKGGDSQQFAYGAVPDLNGDGLADVIVGARAADSGNGRVYVYLADGSGGLKAPVILSRPACENGQLGTYLGASVATAGDVNGDGYPELIAGAPGGSGGALVWMGGPTGPLSPPVQLTRTGTTPAGFGSSVTSVGNVSAFGYAAVAVGTDDPNGTAPGAVYFYPGSATGLPSAPYQTLTGPAPEDLRYGAALASGDFNGDGHGDLVVGAPNTLATKAGHVYLHLGGANGIGATPTVTLTAPVVGGGFGSSVAAANLGPDPYTDIIVGAPGENGGNGRVYLYSGNPFSNFIGSLIVAIDAPAGVTGFGARVAALGDVNQDGHGDIAVAAGNTLYVYYGPFASSPLPTVGTTLIPGVGDIIASVAGAGDFDGDGRADIVVGSLLNGACGSTSQGAARVYRGMNLGTVSPVVLQTSGGDCFGGAVAARDPVLRRLLGGWRG